MPNDNAVANPPAGGPQEQASTNDDNQNTVLRERPYVVCVSAGGQVGVVDRASTKGEADTLAAARKATLPSLTEVTVVKENDPSSGLPALVAEKESAALGLVEDKPAPKPAAAKG
ncbi:MAG TPA: hypothetical protein VMZ73_09030 [Acidimicrobiales bacterium]|nr:hypothetical protein [Acidimicrobiales bacterium]